MYQLSTTNSDFLNTVAYFHRTTGRNVVGFYAISEINGAAHYSYVVYTTVKFHLGNLDVRMYAGVASKRNSFDHVDGGTLDLLRGVFYVFVVHRKPTQRAVPNGLHRVPFTVVVSFSGVPVLCFPSQIVLKIVNLSACGAENDGRLT